MALHVRLSCPEHRLTRSLSIAYDGRSPLTLSREANVRVIATRISIRRIADPLFDRPFV